ncbi:MAG: hypothetical protein M1831_001370 [Alyxoria varia]|nr:MAG: hypothetical protein M1831_001370 [Alyxoria varia]
MAPTTVSLVLQALALLAASVIYLRFFKSPLRAFPGPFWAKLSDFWRLLKVLKGHSHHELRRLHEKHGKAVRVGPNAVSLSDTDLVKIVYGGRGIKAWRKSNFYQANDIQIAKGVWIQTGFSTRDEIYHDNLVRPIRSVFAMSNILKYEGQVDKTIMTLIERLGQNCVSTKAICPMDLWMFYYAWDVIGQITFSQTFGFLEGKDDFKEMLTIGDSGAKYLAIIGQMPLLDDILQRNPIYSIGPPTSGRTGAFLAQALDGRMDGTDGRDATSERDMLDQYIEIKNADSSVTRENIFAYMMINVLAGADTTAVTLRAATYFLAQNQRAQDTLYEALKGLELPISWKTCLGIPYLDAVIKETIRLHPAVATNLERVVPEEGLKLPDGRVLPKGTIVGMNSYVLQTDEAVFGSKPEEFVPDRWLRGAVEEEGAFSARGKNVALLESYKVVAAIISSFKLTLAHPEREWKRIAAVGDPCEARDTRALEQKLETRSRDQVHQKNTAGELIDQACKIDQLMNMSAFDGKAQGAKTCGDTDEAKEAALPQSDKGEGRKRWKWLLLPKEEGREHALLLLSLGPLAGRTPMSQEARRKSQSRILSHSSLRISLCAEKEEKANLQREWPPTEVASQAKELLTLCSDKSTGLVGGKLNFPGQYQNFFVFLDTQDTPPS